ncbi:leucine efflux protein LeuE [Actinocorallia lasiicapitis]
MLGITDLPAYVIGTVLIVLLPGPNSLYVLSTAARRGVRRGYLAASGVFLGDTILMVASALGVASLLKTNDLVFGAVKYAGAAYLLYLAVGMLRSAWKMIKERAAEPAQAAAEEVEEIERPFRRALLISLLNPKAILFFISFFVQFVDPGYATPALSFLVLGVILQFFSFLYLTTLIFSGTRLADAFRRRRKLSATATTAVGAGFLAFAAKLATSSVG